MQIVFLIWIFFRGVLCGNFSDFQKMAGKLWIGRSIECVENFRIFFNGIREAEKSEILGAWELRKIFREIKKNQINNEFLCPGRE